MPGPSKRPTKLRKLEGNPSKRKLPEHEPEPAPGIPACPAHLRAAAKKEWMRITPELYVLGLLTNIDRAALAAYCVNYGRWVETEKQLAKVGKKSNKQIASLYKTTNGNLIINPLLCVSNKAQELMHKFLVEFGMTPASRARLGEVKKGKREDDPMEEVLSRGRQN